MIVVILYNYPLTVLKNIEVRVINELKFQIETKFENIKQQEGYIRGEQGGVYSNYNRSAYILFRGRKSFR